MTKLMNRLWLTIAAAMLSSLLCLTSCGSLEADRLEVDPDRVNVNEDSLDLVDDDKLNVDDENNSLEDLEDNDNLDPETDVD